MTAAHCSKGQERLSLVGLELRGPARYLRGMLFQKFSMLFLLGALGELYLFVKVAVWIGFLPMVLLAASTSMLGVVLLQMQGVALREQLGLAVMSGKLPAPALLEGGMAWISAILLIIPGFLTDALGFVFLIPAVRRGVARRLIAKQGAGTNASQGPRGSSGPRTIEGDFTREKDDP